METSIATGRRCTPASLKHPPDPAAQPDKAHADHEDREAGMLQPERPGWNRSELSDGR